MGKYATGLLAIAGLVLGVAACSDDGGSSGPDARVCAPVDDDNACTTDVCEANQPVHNPVAVGTTCPTGACNATGMCVAPTCTDTLENGTETDVDCGGSCAPASTCDDGQGCAIPADCTSGVCTATVCVAARCGDGVMQTGEMCDDGNDVNGDGCDDGAGDACRATGCGNGVVTGTEVCDDGNAVNGDGCDNNCTVTACGNGVTAGAETCDQGAGNVSPGDGCGATCLIETGYTCTTAMPSVCAAVCGDGLRVGGETCDQGAGNVANGDGCSSTCVIETGYTCTGTPSVCVLPVCGNGVREGTETCDQGAGNVTPGDGCGATCQVEAGFACTGTPSVCTPLCGNNTLDAGEVCDDGNAVGGDGCGATCQLDLGCGAGEVASVVTNATVTPIPDNLPAGVLSPVTVVGAGAVTRAVVYLGSITHTYDGDLDISLVGPSGASRDLSLDNGVGNDNYRRTFFDDGAATAITAGAAPFTGRFRPQASLTTTAGADFRSRSAAGVWNLKVVDDAGVDVGTIDSWSLLLCVNPTAPYCGDGVTNGVDECDDGNPVDTDACTNLCQLTDGCGDGNLDAGEVCDDNNLTPGDGCGATCQIDLTCPAGQTAVILNNLTAAPIPDNDPAGVASPVTVATAGAVTKVVAVIRDVTHTAAADLDLVLIGPNGVTRELSTDNGGTGDHLRGTAFDDAAAVAVGLGVAPFTGGFRPEQSLATTAGVDFRGSRAAGAWTLRVTDDNPTETGTLNGWTLTACVDPTGPYCGDNVINGADECDDGNTSNTDGCTNLCQVSGCGDGVLDLGEACDDDNLIAGDGCSATCTPDISCGPGEQAVVLTNAATTAIPDDASGVISTIAVTTPGLVRRVIPIVNLTHPDTGQLDLFLESPRGVQRDLSSQQLGANYAATIFSDSAAASIVGAVAPFTGGFRPVQPLSNAAGFANQQAQGGWILRIGDRAVGVTGTLTGWSLAVCIDPSTPRVCGNGVVETGETCDDGNLTAADGCSATCQVELGCGAGQTAVVVSPGGLPLLLVDNNPTGVASVATVTGAGTVAKAVVVLGTITHTFDGDLAISLISPAATVIDLSSGNGAADNDYVSTIFDDTATTPITAGVPPMRGRFLPEVALAGVSTQPAAGAWTLRVVDTAGLDSGVLVSWTLGLCVQ